MIRMEALKAAGKLAFDRNESQLRNKVLSAHRKRAFRELAQTWDLWWDISDGARELIEGRRSLSTRREIERYAPWIPPNGAIVDLGCGDGRILKALAPHCGVAYGLDVSDRALERARTLCSGISNLRWRKLAGLRLEFENNRFDLVFCHLMLHTLDLEPVLEYIKEARRILKPGGRFFFDLLHLSHEDNMRYLIRPGAGNWPSVQRPHFWTLEMAEKLVAACGFKVEEIVAGAFLEVRARKIPRR